MRRVKDDMHMTQVTIGYGMTETGPLSFQTSIDDPVVRRFATVGRVVMPSGMRACWWSSRTYRQWCVEVATSSSMTI